jgi:hypothetical protein
MKSFDAETQRNGDRKEKHESQSVRGCVFSALISASQRLSVEKIYHP